MDTKLTPALVIAAAALLLAPAATAQPEPDVLHLDTSSTDLRPRLDARAAFAATLRTEALRFRDTHPWSSPPEELTADPDVVDARSAACRRMLREAAEAGLRAAVRPQLAAHRSASTGTRTGFSLDATPSWAWRRAGSSARWKLDVPLVSDAFRLRFVKRMSDRFEHLESVEGRLAYDPWEDTARFGMVLGLRDRRAD
jgi:hypothetical protein